MKKIVLVLAVLLVSVSACKNPFLKKMLVEEESVSPAVQVPKHTITFGVEGGTGGSLKAEVDGNEITTGNLVEQGKSVVFTTEPDSGYVLEQWTKGGAVIAEAGTDKTYTHTVTADADIKVKFQSLFVEGSASLILSPDKLDISVKAVTSDGSAVAVEGCTETELTSGAETVLHAQGTRVILKGKITELFCGGYGIQNKLTELNVQGLTALKELVCSYNQLTELNVQGLTALERLSCYSNQLTELNVQDLNNLQKLHCAWNRLTALNVQGLTALQGLDCDNNQLTELNVQGLTALQGLYCDNNQLTELNVQDLNNLQKLHCYRNQLTELNVQDLTALQALLCYNNKLTAQAFTKLFDDLPVRTESDDAKCILYTEESGVTEGNCKDFSTPQDLTDAFNKAKNKKKWKMYKRNGSWPGVEI